MFVMSLRGFGRCLSGVYEVFRRCLGRVYEVFGRCLGGFGRFLGVVLEMFGRFWEVFEGFREHCYPLIYCTKRHENLVSPHIAWKIAVFYVELTYKTCSIK